MARSAVGFGAVQVLLPLSGSRSGFLSRRHDWDLAGLMDCHPIFHPLSAKCFGRRRAHELPWAAFAGQDQDNAHLPAEQRKVRKLLKDAGIAMSTMEINARLKKEYDTTAKLLQRMAKDGLLLKAGYGLYAYPEMPTH